MSLPLWQVQVCTPNQEEAGRLSALGSPDLDVQHQTLPAGVSRFVRLPPKNKKQKKQKKTINTLKKQPKLKENDTIIIINKRGFLVVSLKTQK